MTFKPFCYAENAKPSILTFKRIFFQYRHQFHQQFIFQPNKIKPLRAGHTQQTQNICITFTPRRTNVEDVEPTLYKSYTNVLCLLGKQISPLLKAVPTWQNFFI